LIEQHLSIYHRSQLSEAMPNAAARDAKPLQRTVCRIVCYAWSAMCALALCRAGTGEALSVAVATLVGINVAFRCDVAIGAQVSLATSGRLTLPNSQQQTAIPGERPTIGFSRV